ncbi:hypothetical protein [Stenotrophomonas sp. MH181796]|uniref:hypothetical protein n=1 Tax=Stenotrophomonas sp. MH181796 TaxID=2339228 RepID=UPI001E348B70|nr:hypothetical protein [Stenotrophomonas sp. MH181796]
MSNEKKTLADVQPGGRARLGDQALSTGELRRNAHVLVLQEMRTRFTDAGSPSRTAALDAAIAALSAQLSPAGQGDTLANEIDLVRAVLDGYPDSTARSDALRATRVIRAALAARQPVWDQHPDDLAVDAFAAAMKAKMAAARAKGRGGWEDPAQCSADDLSSMLRDHVEKGDPRDVGNFCMMLHQRGEAIATRQPVCGTCAEVIRPDALTGTTCSCASQPVGKEPVTVEAVATVRRWSNGDRYIDWLTEGGIADLEVGDVLMVSDRAITDEDGSGEVYAAPPAQAVDLGQFRQPVQDWLDDAQASMEEHGDYDGVFGYAIEEGTRLLALIDSQAVQS